MYFLWQGFLSFFINVSSLSAHCDVKWPCHHNKSFVFEQLWSEVTNTHHWHECVIFNFFEPFFFQGGTIVQHTSLMSWNIQKKKPNNNWEDRFQFIPQMQSQDYAYRLKYMIIILPLIFGKMPLDQMLLAAPKKFLTQFWTDVWPPYLAELVGLNLWYHLAFGRHSQIFNMVEVRLWEGQCRNLIFAWFNLSKTSFETVEYAHMINGCWKLGIYYRSNCTLWTPVLL